MRCVRPVTVAAILLAVGSVAFGAPPALDESPAKDGEWGFRPAGGGASALNPPRFSWRPQAGASRYELEASRDESFRTVDYRVADVDFNVHAPPREFEPGRWFWRFRAVDDQGVASAWGTTRAFDLPTDAVRFPIPGRAELLARVPDRHPRMFLRPEQLPELRARIAGDLKPAYDELLAEARALLERDIATDEPPLYPPGTASRSEAWRRYWHGATNATTRTLGPAVDLAFAYRISGDKRFGEKAKRLLMAAIEWDPRGSTGYRYNDEAGMPYAYLASRTYSLVEDLLSDAERAKVRRVMRVRGREMYAHLCPAHFWNPYNSHSNRAVHFLGEVAIAFHGEIPEAGDWLWFAVNVFANVYPVWSDDDGGWHEGMAYWRSYMTRFTWWADLMRPAVGIDAYRLPFFAQTGYYAMYLHPPGTERGGFGDQTTRLDARGNVPLMTVFAAQAQNPYWQWYVETIGGKAAAAPHVRFARAAFQPKVEPKPPTDLPTSRLFRGTGQAFLNTTLLDAADNVQVLFKSSPFGSQSHGYDAQNAFQLLAFGKPLFVSTGERDIYGSDHHKRWMWETKSVNSITVGGRGQVPHARTSVGRVTAFHTSAAFDYVEGDAAAAYAPPLRRFDRGILFVKPDLVLVIDRIATPTPETFEWHLHAPVPMAIDAGQDDVRVTNGPASCRVQFLYPNDLDLAYTDRFDPPPRERIKLTEYHMTARTRAKSLDQTFVTAFRPHRATTQPARPASIASDEVVHTIAAEVGGGRIEVRVPRDGSPITLKRFDAGGATIEAFTPSRLAE